MYYALDRLDAGGHNEDGSKFYLQLDVRKRARIEDTLDLTILFTAIRTSSAMRVGKVQGGPYEVVYRFEEQPPLPVQQVIAGLGGKMELTLYGAFPLQGEPADIDSLINESFSRLALQASQDMGIEISVAGVAEYEKRLSKQNMQRDDDEEAYWIAVAKTAAFAGQALKKEMEGRWKISYEDIGMDQITFHTKEGRFNVMSKVQKYIHNGDTDSIHALLKVVLSRPGSQNAPGITGEPTAEKGTGKRGFFGRMFGK